MANFHNLQQLSPFDNEAMRRALVARLNEVPGLAIREDVIDKNKMWAYFKLQYLKGEGALDKLLEILKWVFEEIGQRHQTTRS